MAISLQNAEVIFLDFGHTLAHPDPDWMSHYLDVYEQVLGDRPDEDFASQAVFDVWTNLWPQIESGCWPPSWDEDAARRRQREITIARRLGVTDPAVQQKLLSGLNRRFHNPETYAVYPDVWPALAALRRQGFRLAVLSNWDWELPDLLVGLGLMSYFDDVIVSARVGCAKPDPHIFRQALQKVDVSAPARAIHVGDNIVADMEGAAQAGLRPILIDRDGHFSPEHQAVAGVTKIAALTDLPEL